MRTRSQQCIAVASNGKEGETQQQSNTIKMEIKNKSDHETPEEWQHREMER